MRLRKGFCIAVTHKLLLLLYRRAPAIWVITEILYACQIEVVVTRLQGNVADHFEYKGLDVHINRDGKVVLGTASEPSYFPFAFKVLRLDHDKNESIKFRTRLSNSDI
jgi:hypothetical protein